jgi:hypothetical protein
LINSWNSSDLPPPYNKAFLDYPQCLRHPIPGTSHFILLPGCVFDVLLIKAMPRLDYVLGFDYYMAAEQSVLLANSALILRCQYPGHCNDTARASVVLSVQNASGHHHLFNCSAGRDSNSLLCSTCKPGYYEVSVTEPCVACPKWYNWAVCKCSRYDLMSTVGIYLMFVLVSHHCYTDSNF